MQLQSDSILIPLLKAGAIHILMFVLLLTSFQSTNTEQELRIQVKSAPIIKATAISSATVEKLVQQKQQRIAAAEKAKRDKKRRIQRKVEQKAAKKTAQKNRVALEKKRKIAAEIKRKKAEAEKKRKAEDEKRKAEKRQQLKLENEIKAKLDAQMNAVEDQRILTEVQKYVALIKNKISRNWIIANQTGNCILDVTLAAGGFVIDVRVVGGLASICRTAKAAVYRADPLPVSKDPKVFNKMKNLRLDLDPQEL